MPQVNRDGPAVLVVERRIHLAAVLSRTKALDPPGNRVLVV